MGSSSADGDFAYVSCLWTFQQTIALPDENLFFSVERVGAWQHNDSEGWTSARNLGFVCPVCCKVWGILSGLEGELVFVTSCCRRHAGHNPARVDGSLLYSYSIFEYGNFDQALLAAMPAVLVRREFELHLNHFERS